MTNEERKAKIERRKKEAEMLLDLRSHVILEPIVETLKQNILSINDRLLYAKMDETTRTILMEKRATWQWFLDLFTSAEITLENAKKTLEKL